MHDPVPVLTVGPTKRCAGGSVQFFQYLLDGSFGFQIVDVLDHAPLLKATVRLDTPPPNNNCCWVKGWGENELLHEQLERCDFGSYTGLIQRYGWQDHCEARCFELNPKGQFVLAKQLHATVADAKMVQAVETIMGRVVIKPKGNHRPVNNSRKGKRKVPMK